MPDIINRFVKFKDKTGKYHSMYVTYVRVNGTTDYRMLPEDWMTVSRIINGGNA